MGRAGHSNGSVLAAARLLAEDTILDKSIGARGYGNVENSVSDTWKGRFAMIGKTVFRSAYVSMVILAGARGALAFDSYPTGPGIDSQHDKITTMAFRLVVGKDADEPDELQEAVRDVDWNETDVSVRKALKDDGAFLRPNDQYRSSHHFDRDPRRHKLASGKPDYERAYVEGGLYVRSRLREALGNNLTPQDRVKIIGEVLHAAQDLTSHSNLADLLKDDVGSDVNKASQHEIVRAIVRQFVTPGVAIRRPHTGLWLTAFDPSFKEPGMPKDDPHPHNRDCLDDPDDTDRQKELFPTAEAVAVAISAGILEHVKKTLSKSDWDAFVEACD